MYRLNKVIEKDIEFILNSGFNWTQFRNKTVVITGAYGMLLSYMTITLLKLNELNPDFNVNIIALVRNTGKAAKRFGYLYESKNLKVYQHDLNSKINIKERVDFIIHGASYASPHYYTLYPVEVIKPNVIGTYNLLEFAREKTVKSFLLFSSGAVYGRPLEGEVVTEEYPGYINQLDVKSCYGESKRMAETLCICWSYQYGVPVKIVRPAHIYGPTMDIQNDSRVIASFVKDMVYNQNIIMTSDGSERRSFCYIADATVAFFKVLLDGKIREAYNIGNDSAYISIKHLSDIIMGCFAGKGLKVIIDMGNEEKYNRASLKVKMLMSSKKVESLGWNCCFTLEEGIKRTVESFINE